MNCDKCKKKDLEESYEYGPYHPDKDDKSYCKECFEEKEWILINSGIK